MGYARRHAAGTTSAFRPDEKRLHGCGFSHLYQGVFCCNSNNVPRRPSSAPLSEITSGPEALEVAQSTAPQQKRKKVRFKDTVSFSKDSVAVDDEGGCPSLNTNSVDRKPGAAHRKTSSVGGGSTMKTVPTENVGDAGNSATRRRSAASASHSRSPSNGTYPAANYSTATVGAMGNIVRSGSYEGEVRAVAPLALSMLDSDPDVLKEMGNKEYRSGRFAEAAALYDQAIAIKRDKAPYWSNKAAALIGMGRLMDAVEHCKEAVRLQPSYHKAQHRLATLYLRLGVVVKALHHYQLSGSQSTQDDFARTRALRSHLAGLSDARKRKEWNALLRHTSSAVSAGANSAPQVLSSQAEALLKLVRHHEAELVLRDGPVFDLDASTRFFGPPTTAYVLAVRAQVDIASGRFEDAASAADKAVELEPTSKEITSVVRRVRAVVSCRARGNGHFRESKTMEALSAYEEGLAHEPHNAVLLCNRAACRAKVGWYEEAVRDCDVALRLQPSYTKARLRRADCNGKMGRWEAAARDYGRLVREVPGDEEIRRDLSNARAHLTHRNLNSSRQQEGSAEYRRFEST